jgi:FkbM family methyltransferase
VTGGHGFITAVMSMHRAVLRRLATPGRRVGPVQRIVRAAVLLPVFGSMFILIRLWALVRGPVEVSATTRYGARFPCRLPDLIQTYLYLFGVWEPDITAFIDRRLEAGRTFVDVGANIGYHTLLAACKGARVVAIEASPRIARTLGRNVEANGTTQVRVVNKAVSDHVGTCAIYEGPIQNIGLSTTVPQRGFATEAEVAAAPLSDLLEADEIGSTQLLKIDVEGDEDAVLRGMEQFIEAAPDDIEVLVELSPRWWRDQTQTPGDVLRPLTSAGFNVYTIPNNLWPWRYLWSSDVRPPTRRRGPLTRRVKRLDLVLSRADRETL